MDILIEASQEVAPKRTKRKAKHMNIWNDEIVIALKSNKKALYEWKINGKLQDEPLKDQKKSRLKQNLEEPRGVKLPSKGT
jgi:hypothetical protein